MGGAEREHVGRGLARAECVDHAFAERRLAPRAVEPFADDDQHPSIALSLLFADEASRLSTRPGPCESVEIALGFEREVTAGERSENGVVGPGSSPDHFTVRLALDDECCRRFGGSRRCARRSPGRVWRKGHDTPLRSSIEWCHIGESLAERFLFTAICVSFGRAASRIDGFAFVPLCHLRCMMARRVDGAILRTCCSYRASDEESSQARNRDHEFDYAFSPLKMAHGLLPNLHDGLSRR